MISQHKAVVSIIESLFILPVALLAGSMGSLAAPGGNGVDDLRGQWDFTVTELNSQPLDLKVFINDLGPDPSNRENFYVAAGCLQTTDNNTTAPLSMQAINQGNGKYALTMLSTVVPTSQGQPFVVKFIGTAITDNRGVNNDEASGTVSTSFANGNWSATHHDRRRTDCPPVEIPPLNFWADVRAHHNLLNGNLTEIRTILEGQTDIVSTGMLVKKPNGTSVIVPTYTDIFSPNVDFITQFRYVIPFNQADAYDPIVGQPYTFTLLDALGNPIPGTTKIDVWTACLITPPQNLNATVTSDLDIYLAWDPVLSVSGFNPASGIGFYQIDVDPWPPGSGQGSVYGSNHIKSTFHLIPWKDFVPGAPGSPDGFNLGVGLNKLLGGTYQIRVDSFSVPPPGSAGVNLECTTVDFGEALLFEKTNGSIQFP